jgi:hypothetical protein
MGELREHRADIRRPNDGLVIELQHSYIKHEHVREREAFYGNMWWVFNTEPWRFRVEVAAGGRANFRWMSRRRTLDAAKRPIYLDTRRTTCSMSPAMGRKVVSADSGSCSLGPSSSSASVSGHFLRKS